MKLNALTVCYLLLFMLAGGCLPPSKMAEQKVFKNGNYWIPADFNAEQSVLLVQKLAAKEWKAEKRNAEMAAYLQEKYPHKYELVTGADIENNEAYADKLKYAFVLVPEYGYIQYSGTTGRTTRPVYDFFFKDRNTGRKYPATTKYSSNPIWTFKAVINTIVARSASKG